MGVSTNFMMVWGIKMPWNKELADFYEEKYPESSQGPWLLFDGMGGEYILAGVKLWDSGDARWGFEDGDGHKVLDPRTFPAWEKAYKEHFQREYPQFSYLMFPDFQLHALAHFS